MNLINIENLTKVYTERKLFDGASFSLQDGEKVGIIGVNGTGKTTLLRMIMGEEETDEGTVTTANHVVMRYLPQHPEFEPEKSSLECVLEGNVTDENRWSVESDAKAMMTRLGIKDFMQPDGKIGYVQPIGEKAIPGQVVDANSTSNFGVGAFLLAACERVRYLNK